jgi:hypothetical protein
MRFSILAASLLSAAAVMAQPPVPEAAMIPEAYSTQGTASVNPDKGISGEHGTWTVTYTVGESGIVQGGGIRVELPDEWHSGPRNSGNRLQTKDPKLDNYITAKTTASGVTLQCIVEDERDETLIKHPKKSLDGRTERFVFVVRVIVTGGALKAGDVINVVYGDTSGGSKGYWGASVSALPLPILIALDPDGDSRPDSCAVKRPGGCPLPVPHCHAGQRVQPRHRPRDIHLDLPRRRHWPRIAFDLPRPRLERV